MPVVQPRNMIEKQGFLHNYTQKEIEEFEDLKLPEGFKWTTFDVENDEECAELDEFL